MGGAIARSMVFCPTRNKEVLLPTSLPAGEICPVCERSKEKCDFSITPITEVKAFCYHRGEEGTIRPQDLTMQDGLNNCPLHGGVTACDKPKCNLLFIPVLF